MISWIRRRLTYANVAMTLALVFAMSGGAYAAHKYLINSTKQINPKVLKALKGQAGPRGETGPQGPPGAKGDKGETGAPGANGVNGKDGSNGANGVSVTSKALLTTEVACSKRGGSEFTAAENKKTTACNGAEGPAGPAGLQGPPGDPWTAGGVLPKGATETGTFSISTNVKKEESVWVTVSFPIPLASPIEESHVQFMRAKERPRTGCEGGTPEKPIAEQGYTCFFAQFENENIVSANATLFSFASGAGVLFSAPEELVGNAPEAQALAFGTWAVTAP